MNIAEKKMVELLREMKELYNVVEIKTEFESEAARLNEVMRLKDVVEKAGLGLVIKTGGPEAIRDLYDACIVGVTGIVAPMVESAYALKKYLGAIEKFVPHDLKHYIKFAVNIETIQAHKNFDEMLALKGAERLSRITLGRVDMVGSLGMGRDDINRDEILEIARAMFKKAKAKGFETTMGGGIAKEAIPFIKKLVAEKLLDRYETRKVVFQIPARFDEALVEEAIIKANAFELLWLENKRNYYAGITGEDDGRIGMLEKRVGRIS